MAILLLWLSMICHLILTQALMNPGPTTPIRPNLVTRLLEGRINNLDDRIGSDFDYVSVCKAGYVDDTDTPKPTRKCQKCEDDQICPIGTTYAFDDVIDDLNTTSDILSFKLSNWFTHFKNSSIFTFCIMGLLLPIFIATIFIIWILVRMKSKTAIGALKSIDCATLTCSRQKSIVGGILTLLLIYCTIISVLTNWQLHVMSRIKTRDVSKLSTYNPEMGGSYKIEFQVFLTTLDHNKTVANMDLCDNGQYQVRFSDYFQNAINEIDENYFMARCTREDLTEFTQSYTILVEMFRLPPPSAKLAEEDIIFELNTQPNQIVHFFTWEIDSIWQRGDKYSTTQGSMSPGLENGLSGPNPTIVKFEMTPRHYTSFVKNIRDKGYEINFDKIEQVGSIFDKGLYVTSKALADRYNGSNPGFKVKFEFTQSNFTFLTTQINVQNLLKTIVKIIKESAFCLIFINILRRIIGLNCRSKPKFPTSKSDKIPNEKIGA